MKWNLGVSKLSALAQFVREPFEQEQVDDTERAPEPPKALQDQAGMADAGHRTEAQHHLLIDIEDRHQQQ